MIDEENYLQFLRDVKLLADEEKDEDDGGWLVFVLAAAAALFLLLLLCRLCLRTGPPERSPLDRANLVSRATFWWVTPTLSAALRKGVLDLDDLPALPAADQPRRRLRNAGGGR